ncbi:PrsW family intramembrane metalloprotease [Demequina aurantiaca]|uniref:PrsW family intramembrane metalloprotease n=1 Tax=Demequina aurantiaca TaxID=676200 RepID=UPI000784112F|nr:PrsW family intramembrane metalloprotease [Demequina aurantiaca]
MSRRTTFDRLTAGRRSSSAEPPTATAATPVLRHSPRTRSFVDIHSLVFWVFMILSAYGLIQVTPLLLRGMQTYPAAGMLAVILWSLYALAFVFVVYKLELFERRSPVTIFGALMWGSLVCAGIGVVAAPAMHGIVASWLGEDSPWITAVSAPLVEEPLKMLGVVALALIPGARVRSAADGLFYGAIIGLGFMVVESYLYTMQAAVASGGNFDTVFQLVILRGVVSGLWSHATLTAIAGAGVGYFFNSTRGPGVRWGVMLGGLGVAMLLHAFFDAPLLDTNVYAATIAKGIPVFVMLLVVLRVVHKRERSILAHLARDTVPDHLVSSLDFALLSNRTIRSNVRTSARRSLGLSGALAMRQLQQSQLALLSAAHEDGMDSERADEATEHVLAAQAALAQLRADAAGHPATSSPH